MPGRRFDELDTPAEERSEPARPAAPRVPAEAVLALQRSAGNAAVSGVLQRKFYEKTGSGSYVWHGEKPDDQWVNTGETTWWLMPFWRYPVYQHASTLPALAPDEELETEEQEAEEPEAEEQAASTPATKKRRRGKRKKKGAAAPVDAIVEAATTQPPAVTEPPEEEAEQQQEEDDGFQEVKSRSAAKKEAAANVDVNALATAIDAHRGPPARILETFNRLFNGLDAQSLLQTGAITSAYRSSYDRRSGGFSVEVTIPPLQNWVLHAHLRRDGTIQPGENATHYKRTTDRFELAVSIALLQKQIDALVPDETTCHDYAVNTARLTL
ncbi:MAG TPA: hypothetical protein VNO82_19000 [Solirubrobacteraceae bacterium]|nr:hypothetical protein [Solirubrobacteraceae bacterium]